jgi:biopolymer transport protein ExbD/biopolymer transport protein TolR
VKAESKQVFNDINITPLTDIFLVLLIIMMVVAPLLEYRQLNLAVLPNTQSESTPPSEKPKSVHVLIDASGAIKVEGNDVAPADLVQQLRDEVATKPDGLIIETHPDAPFEAMATALDAAETAQITQVATVETNTAPPPPAAAPEKKSAKKK